MMRLAALLLALLWCSPAHAQVPLTRAGRSAGAGGPITCAQGTTFLARTAGLDAAHQTAYQNTICHLVLDGIITGDLTGATGGCGVLLDALYLMATQTAAAAALNICGTSYSLVANGAPVFTANSGWTGVNGSTTVFLNTQFQPNTGTPVYALNSAHTSAWSLSNNAEAADAVPIGSFWTGVHDQRLVNISHGGSNQPMIIMNTGSTVSNPPPLPSFAGWLHADTNGATSSLYRNGVLFMSGASVPTQIPVSALFVLAASNGGSTAGISGSAQTYGMASYGARLTPAQITALYNDVCNFWMMPIHGSC